MSAFGHSYIRVERFRHPQHREVAGGMSDLDLYLVIDAAKRRSAKAQHRHLQPCAAQRALGQALCGHVPLCVQGTCLSVLDHDKSVLFACTVLPLTAVSSSWKQRGTARVAGTAKSMA